MEKNNKCYFINKLPLEIRNEVYKLLLVNEELASPVELYRWHGRKHKIEKQYRLEPSILRTCRQINTEAGAILYNENTFVADFTCKDEVQSPIIRKPPLERTLHDYQLYLPTDDPIELSPLTKVKKWKFLLNSWDDLDDFRGDRATMFCRAICLSPTRSLKILVLPVNTGIYKELSKDQSHLEWCQYLFDP